MKALSALVAALSVAAFLLLASRPEVNDGTPTTVDTTTTVTVPISPTLPEPLTADADTAAVRGHAIQLTEPPPAPATTTIPTEPCAEMSWYRQQAGLPERFDGIGYRESRCRNEDTVRTFCCYGYWQNYISSHLSRQSAYRDRIINECGVTGADDINSDTPDDKQRSACVTYVVWSISGLSPWKATA